MAGVDLQKMREKLARRKKEQEDRKKAGQTFGLKEGENRIRMLPPWDDSGEWAFEAWYHYNVSEKPLLCPKQMFKEDCPICEYSDQLFKTREKEDRELSKKIYAKRRYFAGVLDLSETAPTPKIMSFGVELHDTFLAAFDPVDGHGDYTDPLKGKNIKIDVVGEKINRRCTTTISPNASPIGNWAEVKKSLINIKTKLLADRLNYDQLKNILEGVEETPVEATTEPQEAEVVETLPPPVVEAPKTPATPAAPTSPNRAALNSKLEALRKLKNK